MDLGQGNLDLLVGGLDLAAVEAQVELQQQMRDPGARLAGAAD